MFAGVVAAAALCVASGAEGRHQAESCVTRLLQPPTRGKFFFIENPGRLNDNQGKGGQEILTFLKYRAVPGCDALERRGSYRLQEKRRGQPWTFPYTPVWFPESGAREPNGANEFGFEDGNSAGTAPATCVGGARPIYRLQVRTRVIRAATGKVAATSPTTTLSIPYKPRNAARC